MRLDVVVPTYNRSKLLRAAVQSLLRAPVPEGLEVRVIVVDNNSPDDTAEVVREIQATATLPVLYVLETRQGSSRARNAGIEAGDAELIGFIDDDEEIDGEWYRVIAREFADPKVQFIGGSCLGNWATPAPKWLPSAYPAAIGVIPPKPRAPLDDTFGGNLMSGNCVLRRAVFEQVGMYNPALGRSNKGLLSEEDAEFYGRIRKARISGMYVPDLVIYHYIAPERLTRRYYRRWVYWRGVSQSSLTRERPEPGPQLLGIPRYKFGRALRAFFAIPRYRLAKGGQPLAFEQELFLWELAGWVYGRWFVDIHKLYGDHEQTPSVAQKELPKAG